MLEKEKIAELISSGRKEQGLTQKQLAEKLFVTDKAVSKWECGNGYPDIQTLPLLAEILDLDMDELIFGDARRAAEQAEKMEEVAFRNKKSSRILLAVPIILLALFSLAALLSSASYLGSAGGPILGTQIKQVLADYLIGWVLLSCILGFIPLLISYLRFTWKKDRSAR